MSERDSRAGMLTDNIARLDERINRLTYFSGQAGDRDAEKRELEELAEAIGRLSDGIQDLLTSPGRGDPVPEEDIAGGGISGAYRDRLFHISHELKTPLAVMSAHVELLRYAPERIDRDYYYGSLLEEADGLSEMMKNLRDLDPLEQDPENIVRTPMDLAVSARRLTDRNGVLLRQKGAALEFHCQENLTVRGNERLLSHAMENYLTNAVKHVREGGRIRFTLVRDGGDILCSVYNDGENIPEESEERIWERNVVLSGQQGGSRVLMGSTGLGLYIVRRIVEIHRGCCGAENREHGVLFWMRIPACGGESGEE